MIIASLISGNVQAQEALIVVGVEKFEALIAVEALIAAAHEALVVAKDDQLFEVGAGQAETLNSDDVHVQGKGLMPLIAAEIEGLVALTAEKFDGLVCIAALSHVVSLEAPVVSAPLV
jgi:hypothetical protein